MQETPFVRSALAASAAWVRPREMRTIPRVIGGVLLSMAAADERAAYAADPVSNYDPSPVIRSINFDFSTVRTEAPSSDNWAITWADDGNQYATWGDGGGFGGTQTQGRVSLGVARIEGSKTNYEGYNVWGGEDPENPATFDGKSYGILSVDGTLWMWRGGAGSDEDVFEFQELYRSPDHGANWYATGVRFDDDDFTNSNAFFAPTFLQFGRDYDGARDDFVYAYASNTQDDSDWNVQHPGEITLMRVRKDKMENPGAYRYFAGMDQNNQPIWKTNINARQPTFEDPDNGTMRVSVSYNEGLDRYFLITQQVSRYEDEDGHIGIYDAPEPWGPWTTVLFDNPWDIGLQEGYKDVYWNFSNKWLSNNGRKFTLVYTGPGADEWGTVQGAFSLHPQPQPSADFDYDGDVDLDDYNILSGNMGQTAGVEHSDGDANGDGVVDFEDFVLLALNFSGAEESIAGGVPEPSVLALSIMGALLAMSRRRRRAEL